MVDYNIEVAHIYTDQQFGPEQETSLFLARRLIDDLDRTRQSYCISLLVDDYHPDNSALDLDAYVRKVREFGIQVDFLVLEGALVRYREHVLEQMKPNLRRRYESYFARKHKLPCSFLLACWYELRLGIIQEEDPAVIRKISDRPVEFPGRAAISVIPRHFEDVEISAKEILLSTPHASASDRISYVYH